MKSALIRYLILGLLFAVAVAALLLLRAAATQTQRAKKRLAPAL